MWFLPLGRQLSLQNLTLAFGLPLLDAVNPKKMATLTCIWYPPGMTHGYRWLTAMEGATAMHGAVPRCHALVGLVPLLSHCSRMGWEAGFRKES